MDVRSIEFTEFGATNLHPVAIGFMLTMTALALTQSRSVRVLGVLAVCVFMPMEQRLVVGGLDFSMMRLMMIMAWGVVWVRGEHRELKFGKLDRYIIFWALSAAVFYVLRIGPSGIVYRLGVAFDVLTAYFLIRVLVRSPGDVLILWRNLAWLVIALSPFLLYEFVTKHNAFGIFSYGGFEFVEVRDGRARSQGPFSHPILAGSFAGAVMPVFFGLVLGWQQKRRLFLSGCIAATAIIGAAGSSGPAMAWIVGFLGWGLWRFRKHTRAMMWGVVCVAVVLHFIREQPVWQLIGRLSSITGGTGYHRARLIDAFIRRFGDWALVGTDDTAHWGWGLQDTTSQYVAEGITGGFVTFILFIVLLRIGFVQLRLSRQFFERSVGPRSVWALLCWGASVSLAVHCVSFISVSYFDQTFQFLLFFFATIPALANSRRPRRKRLRQRTPHAVGSRTVGATQPS